MRAAVITPAVILTQTFLLFNMLDCCAAIILDYFIDSDSQNATKAFDVFMTVVRGHQLRPQAEKRLRKLIAAAKSKVLSKINSDGPLRGTFAPSTRNTTTYRGTEASGIVSIVGRTRTRTGVPSSTEQESASLNDDDENNGEFSCSSDETDTDDEPPVEPLISEFSRSIARDSQLAHVLSPMHSGVFRRLHSRIGSHQGYGLASGVQSRIGSAVEPLSPGRVPEMKSPLETSISIRLRDISPPAPRPISPPPRAVSPSRRTVSLPPPRTISPPPRTVSHAVNNPPPRTVSPTAHPMPSPPPPLGGPPSGFRRTLSAKAAALWITASRGQESESKNQEIPPPPVELGALSPRSARRAINEGKRETSGALVSLGSTLRSLNSGSPGERQ
eukprot:1350375-Amorphochlora_amoeboformis.AAC.1